MEESTCTGLGADLDVQHAVGGLVQDTVVPARRPVGQPEGRGRERRQVQARLLQHQRQHLRAHVRMQGQAL